MRSGLAEKLPYSLSRWTDLPGGKWSWFEKCLAMGQMVAFDPYVGAPAMWSLKPQDTMALVFWTKDPSNLIASQIRLEPYNVAVHVTATGWQEVEKGTPPMELAGRLLVETARAFPLVHWRFSPIPLLPSWVVLERFKILLGYAETAGLKTVDVSYLQTNDLLPETRSVTERFDLLQQLAEEAAKSGLKIALCRDDQSLAEKAGALFELGVCVPSYDFPGHTELSLDTCKCVRMVDPFTVNESCTFGCKFCYAGDKSLSAKKRNTTRLKVVP
jgi:Domain of unknown function (DUF1848)